MENQQELKNIVRDKYAQIALDGKANSCCGSSGPDNKIYNMMMDDYTGMKGYVAEADFGLGCGLPTQFTKITSGDTVLDLGSGAGNDAFVARHETGSEGKVIGIDFATKMIEKARENAEKLGFNNVEFREGDIEKMPVNDKTADVVVSNCVLNLVPNKAAVFNEINRVLKPGGHFSISDIVLEGELPMALRKDAEMYAGCVAGAIQRADYLNLIKDAGFIDIAVQKVKPVSLPQDLVGKYLSPDESEEFFANKTGIFSISVYAKKPGPTAEDNPQTKSGKQDHQENQVTDGSGCC